ncbi:MAG: hypothetical protein WC284_16380 [Candidimonas sp.]
MQLLLEGSLTTFLPFTVSLPDLKESLPMIDGKYVIPSNSFRGKLRRATFDVINDARMAAGEEKITLETARLHRQGGMVAKGPSTFDLDEYRRVSSDPQLSLWGTMSYQVSGKMSVAHASFDSDVKMEMIMHVRGDDFSRDPNLIDEILKSGEFDAIVEENESNKKTTSLRKEIIAINREISRLIREKKYDELELIKKEKQSKEVELSSKNNSMKHPGLGFPVIPPGNKAKSIIRGRNLTKIEAALFLRGLIRWGQDPVIGGKLNQCGLFLFNYDVKIGINGKYETVGNINNGNDPFGGISINLTHPDLAEYDQVDFSKTYFEAV